MENAYDPVSLLLLRSSFTSWIKMWGVAPGNTLCCSLKVPLPKRAATVSVQRAKIVSERCYPTCADDPAPTVSFALLVRSSLRSPWSRDWIIITKNIRIQINEADCTSKCFLLGGVKSTQLTFIWVVFLHGKLTERKFTSLMEDKLFCTYQTSHLGYNEE